MSHGIRTFLVVMALGWVWPDVVSAAELVARLLSPDLATAVRVDGRFDEAAWEGATVVSGFLQREPNEGEPATYATEVRVAYDAASIYVAITARDPEPSRLVGFRTRRDLRSSSDWLRVVIDSYHDRRTAYEFAVNPVGVKLDTYWFNDGSNDDSWDAIWDVEVTRDDDCWRAEFRIPFSQLRFGADGRAFGFAVVREVARLNEVSTWPLLARSAVGYVSNFGELTNVTVPSSAKRLELVPYSVSQVVTQPVSAGSPLRKAVDPGALVGVDVRYALTPSLNATATLNPDFGQVEADPAVVNLTAFEQFFAERRPFFVEGSGNYRFDINCNDGQCTGLFYSRRIGRPPRGAASVAGGFSERPLQSTILGATKVTGRVGAFSLGVLAAATQEEQAQMALGARRWAEVVEPLTAYTVVRARREWTDQSTLGMMLTSTNRRLTDAVAFLPDNAITGGVDYDWRFGGSYSLSGHWAGSSVSGSSTAIADLQRSAVHTFQRPDAEHVQFDPSATSLRGHAGQAMLQKIRGERTRVQLALSYRSPGFEINDMGFLRRADEIPQFAWVQWRFDRPGAVVRQLRINFNQWSTHNFGGDRLAAGANVNANWTFTSLWSAGGGVFTDLPAFDDRLTRGGPGGRTNARIGSWQYLNTNDRKQASLHLNTSISSDGLGSHAWEVSPRVALRPSSAVSAELGIRWAFNTNDAQWVGSADVGGATRYVFGRLRQDTTAVTARFTVTLTPELSLQLYGQPFVSSGRYESYKALVDGRADRYQDRYAPFEYQGNGDFGVLSFRTTNVLRWEFKPGSTLFVVWQQGREGVGDPRSIGIAEPFSVAGTSTALVKLAYWMNP